MSTLRRTARPRPGPPPSRIAVAVVALLVVWGVLLAPGGATAAPVATPVATAVGGATTGAVERHRVDTLPTPRLRWHACDGGLCTTMAVPLDYDEPRGPSVSVAVLKAPATDPAHRIGSLFLNPGGPGGSGQDIVRRAADILSPELRARFDLVGMDPRGTNDSTRVQCYPDTEHQAVDTDVLGTVFPLGPVQEQQFGRAADHLATACSTVGRPLSASMSTAEVARDMELLRRAVGDERLTFLGWSYGTYLGQVYANMFPDRVRAVAVDGVIDPVAWRGTAATRDLPATYRLDSGVGSSRALRTVLRRCRLAGPPQCPLARPRADFAAVAEALRAEPLVVTDEDGSYEVTYAAFVATVLFSLYLPDSVTEVPLIVSLLQELIADRSGAAAGARATDVATVAARYGRVQKRLRSGLEAAGVTAPDLMNAYELNAAVLCSDSRNPHSTRRWAELGDRADRRSPYFGRYWLWGSATCAGWTAFDEDAYAGPFDRWTAAPVLVVGNVFDPATSYGSALSVARRLPNSRLLRSISWGHTAYGTSTCATSAVDRYLIDGTLPPRHTVCVGDVQPYAS